MNIKIDNSDLIGEGATAKIYSNNGKAIKVYENANLSDIENEAKRQQFAFDANLPVPRVYAVYKLENNKIAFEMELINGQPLMHLQMDKDERRNAVHTLVKLQCQVHKVKVDNLPRQADYWKEKIKRTQNLDCSLKEKILVLLDQMRDDSNQLCHGDFHPLNVLYDGGDHWIIDWVDATVGNPLADACRTYLIFKQFINRSSGIYLKAFCKEANVRQEEVLAWLPIVAAARVDEGMNDKQITLLKEMIHVALGEG